MHRGYVKLWRKAFDSGMHRNHKLFILWLWILGHAAYKPTTAVIGTQQIKLEPGQMIIGRQKLATNLNMSEQNVRTCLSALESFGNITTKSTNKFSVLTVVNWESYQSLEEDFNQQPNQQLTSGSPAGNQRLTTSKEVKKVKKEKKEEYNADPIEAQTAEVVSYLNQATGKRFTSSGLIPARLRSGATVEDCKRVIDNKLADPKFDRKYLDHTTLFREGNFDRYLNETPADHKPQGQQPANGPKQPPKEFKNADYGTSTVSPDSWLANAE